MAMPRPQNPKPVSSPTNHPIAATNRTKTKMSAHDLRMLDAIRSYTALSRPS
jgi:hypothetical protein